MKISRLQRIPGFIALPGAALIVVALTAFVRAAEPCGGALHSLPLPQSAEDSEHFSVIGEPGDVVTSSFWGATKYGYSERAVMPLGPFRTGFDAEVGFYGLHRETTFTDVWDPELCDDSGVSMHHVVDNPGSIALLYDNTTQTYLIREARSNKPLVAFRRSSVPIRFYPTRMRLLNLLGLLVAGAALALAWRRRTKRESKLIVAPLRDPAPSAVAPPARGIARALVVSVLGTVIGQPDP
jgi:hypothetical protein